MRDPREQIKYYRDKAEELRALIDGMTTAEARAAIHQVAAEYDSLAEKAEQRARATQLRRESLPAARQAGTIAPGKRARED